MRSMNLPTDEYWFRFISTYYRDYQGTEELMAKKVSQVVKETKGQMELKDTLDHEDDEETEVLMDHEEPQDQPENQDQQATPLTPKSWNDYWNNTQPPKRHLLIYTTDSSIKPTTNPSKKKWKEKLIWTCSIYSMFWTHV